MTRIIKFRAWDRRKNKMIGNVSTGTISVFGEYEDYDHTSESKDCDFMQYTGLKDKNGKEIYEGDIVKVYQAQEYVDNPKEVLEDEHWNERNAFICKEVIEWSESGGYFLDTNEVFEYNAALGSEDVAVEIIGNIYENPNLLK